ncbi:MAG TPA: two-component regulator propeller domain-containing protein, partial [Lacibacter sp.]|nr:two-component regulator propeller domain-containing protein [Lacibacter sp.]
MPGICYYAFCIILLAGCTTQYSPDKSLPQALYAEPLVVPINIADGYIINKLTGDSIKPFINSTGDTISTGVPLILKGDTFQQPAVSKPLIIREDTSKPILITDNTRPIKYKPETIVAKPDTLKSYKISAQTDSIVINNKHFIKLTSSQLLVDTFTIPLHEPKPVKTQPMRYKDNAILDIQYMDIGQGLKYSYINNLCQDQKGNIWMATDYGISKYDGTYITHYSESEGLIHNRVNVVHADNRGRIWAGTQKGICVLDGNKFIRLSDQGKIFNSEILHISNGTDGNIWIKSTMGLICYTGSLIKLFTYTNSFPENSYSQIQSDHKGNIWLSGPAGVIKYDGTNYLHLNPGTDFLTSFVDVKEDAKGNTWFACYAHGVTKYDGNIFTKYNYKSGLSENTITSMMIDRKDRVWVGTRYNGLNLLIDSSNTIFKNEHGLSENK